MAKLAEEHMDFLPEVTDNLLENINIWIKYWKTDLLLAQNYYKDRGEIKRAKDQINFLQSSLKNMEN